MKILISRVWAMPNKWTFQIKPIKELLDELVGDGELWIDPFAGMYSPAKFTNDLNPNSNAQYHLEAVDFLNQLNGKFVGCLFDPPYSLTQVSKSYNDMGLKFKGKENPTGGFPKAKDRISELIQVGGMVISFGWNTIGMGKKRGFEIEEIMIVSHGGNRNDTLITIENKVGTMGEGKNV